MNLCRKNRNVGHSRKENVVDLEKINGEWE